MRKVVYKTGAVVAGLALPISVAIPASASTATDQGNGQQLVQQLSRLSPSQIQDRFAGLDPSVLQQLAGTIRELLNQVPAAGGAEGVAPQQLSGLDTSLLTQLLQVIQQILSSLGLGSGLPSVPGVPGVPGVPLPGLGSAQGLLNSVQQPSLDQVAPAKLDRLAGLLGRVAQSPGVSSQLQKLGNSTQQGDLPSVPGVPNLSILDQVLALISQILSGLGLGSLLPGLPSLPGVPGVPSVP